MANIRIYRLKIAVPSFFWSAILFLWSERSKKEVE